jgi:hypothetical protein
MADKHPFTELRAQMSEEAREKAAAIARQLQKEMEAQKLPRITTSNSYARGRKKPSQ